MSGASEATLQELLEVNRSMADAIRGLASKGGGGSGGSSGGGTSGLSTAGKALNDAAKGAGQMGAILGTGVNVALGTFKTALQIATAGFNAFKKVGDAVIQGQKQLAESAIEGSGGLSTFAEAMSGLPFKLGLIADAYAYQQKILEKNLHTYQELSSVGASFGGSLQEVRTAAMGVGLSMGEFSAMMKNNGPALIKLGFSAEDGAKKLVKFNTDLIKGEVGQGLLGLGYSLKEANDLLGGYATIVGGLNESQMKDQKRMEQSVASFASEMDLSAQLEGKSRQQKEEEMKKASANAAIQAKLATMTQDQKDKYQLALSNALRTGGQGAADALNSTLLGLPPMTKAAQMFTAVMPGANKAVQENAKIVQDSSKASEAEGKIRENGAKGAVAAANDIKKLGKAADALSYAQGGNADLQSTINAGKKLEAQQTNQGIKTEKDAIDQQKKLIEEQEKRKKSEAGLAAQAEARAKFQANIMETLYAALAELWPIVEELVMGFTNLLVAAMPLIKQGIGFIKNLYSDVIKPAFTALFGGMKIDDIIAPFKAFFKGLFGDGGADLKAVGTSVSGFLTKVRTFFSDMFGAIDFEGVGKKVRETFGKVFGALGKIATSLGKLFGGSGSDGAQVGSALEKAFTIFLDIVGGIADIIGDIVEQFTQTSLFQTLKEMIDSFVGIFMGVLNIIKKIVAGPIGTWLVKALSAAGELFIAPFKLALDAIDFMVQLIDGFIDIFKGDSEKGWKTIGDATKRMLKGIIDWFLKIPKFLWEFFGGSWASVSKAISDLVDGFVDAVTGFFSKIFSFFSSSAKDKAEAKVKETPKEAQAAARPDAVKWAHDVFTKNKDMNQVPGEIKGDVQKLLNTPDKAWIEEVNNRTQTNSKPPEPKTAPPKTAEEPKPVPVAQTDLNNKDAIGLLKTIADYQYKTVNAVTALNGNLYRK
jgi:hypothetical protein